MAKLSSLPNELLLNIYASCPNLKTAISLSATKRSLHELWVDNSYQLAMEILRACIDEFDGALALATGEIRYMPYQASLQSGSGTGSPHAISQLIPRLLDNAALAASAIEGYHTFTAGLPPPNYRHSLQLSSIARAYYLIRSLVSVEKFGNAEDRQVSRKQLENLPERELRTAIEVSDFLLNFASDEERRRQDIAKDEADWSIDDELVALPAKDEWDNATSLIYDVYVQRRH